MNRDDELERLLASRDLPPLPDPARFVDRVMERVAASEREAPRPLVHPATRLPWWVEAAADPAAVLACILMALVLWKPGALDSVGSAASSLSLPAPVLAWIRAALPLERPTVALAFEFLGCVALVWLSIHLYRWTQRLTLRAVRH